MPQRGPLHWADGEGWLVLLGGGDWQRGETDLVDANVLSLANLDRPMIVMLSEGDQEDAESILEHYVNLGGPGGEAYILNHQNTPRTLHDPAFGSLLTEAGILYLGGEDPLLITRTLRSSPALLHIVKGFATIQGLLLLGSGGGAAALGTWFPGEDPSQQDETGLNFIQNAAIIPHFTHAEEANTLQALLRTHPGSLGLGIPNGTALALGPKSEVETWGSGDVTAIVHKDI